MGKKRFRLPERHKHSLGEQIEDPETYGVRTKPRAEKRRKGVGGGNQESDDEEGYVPGALSDRILKVARDQQEELDAGVDDSGTGAHGGARGALAAAVQGLADAHDSDSDSDIGAGGSGSDGGSGWDEDGWEAEMTAEDEAALAAFMAPGAQDYKQRTLSDLIMDKIKEKQGGAAGGAGAEGAREGAPSLHPALSGAALPQLNAKVIEVYQGVGKVMQRYTAGRVPKAFKVIPNLRNWEEILFLTDPEEWSPHAVYQATRMFVSNLNAKMAQRFLALVLLPHVRSDIQNNRRLHFALFQALKKATYKPGAFYKGLLLPLCASGTCTLREAVIVTSVLRRASIPVLHSAAALLRIAEMPYSGVNSFFIRVLLDKRYALPYRVVDALVDHFTQFASEERQLPVVWHQALLAFVQRYKAEVRKEDKAALRELCRRQHHYQVTPEVVRELDASRSRGEKAEAAAAATKVGAHVRENPRDLAPVIIMDE